MVSLKQRFLSASAGAMSAICVFGVAFAAQPKIAADEVPVNEVYEYAQRVTDDDMEALEGLMDEDTLDSIKGALVEDSNTSIIMSYVQQDEGFAEVLAEYYAD